MNIISDLPIPPKTKTGRKPKYPWRELGIGDSFLAPTGHISSRAAYAGKRLGMKFTVRKVADGWRVWRIA